ncbi:hypothetical protein HPB49_021130 [Dermacentor silvarum]|uniref:Uncharacterized protein n=1 Tax=Dermacentor silvarum TaxID=543639 RepID=A0ACB8E349_DERSI|nr:hypothetical protein HPB49_021130 [Dermacentor silvarum]
MYSVLIDMYKHKVEGLQRKLAKVELRKAIVEDEVRELKDSLVAEMPCCKLSGPSGAAVVQRRGAYGSNGEEDEAGFLDIYTVYHARIYIGAARLQERSNETAHSSAPKRCRSNKDPLSPGVRLTMGVRMRLQSDRDSETTSIVLMVITPAPMVRLTPTTSRHPTTEESTMVSPNRKRRSNEVAQSSATKRRQSKKDQPSPGVWVNVAVRVRLLSVRDLQTPSIVRVLDDRCHVFNPKAQAQSFHFEGGGNVKHNEDERFMFQQFLDETKDNVYVFENTTRGMLTMLLKGCNCSVFACISTGTDKAFALLGSEECHGVVFLMASEFYQRVDKLRSEGQTCDVAVTCLEVYNKVVRDLLCLDPAISIALLYITIHKVKEAGALLELLLKAKKYRTQHATDANAESAVVARHLPELRHSNRECDKHEQGNSPLDALC